MSAFTISAAVGIIALCICMVIRFIRLAILILKILFALLSKICHLFRKSRKTSPAKKYHSKMPISGNFSPEEIGRQGEDDLCRKLHKIEKGGIILRNLYIPTSNGNTAEIDAVMLTRHGIYVFEYKNYHCNMLIPDSEESNWIRFAYNSSVAYEVYSPVKQNRNHVKALVSLLAKMSGTHGIENAVNSYVILGNGCRILTERKSSTERAKILNLYELNRLPQDADIVIPELTIMLLKELLGRYCEVADAEKTSHILNVEKNKNISRTQDTH